MPEAATALLGDPGRELGPVGLGQIGPDHPGRRAGGPSEPVLQLDGRHPGRPGGGQPGERRPHLAVEVGAARRQHRHRPVEGGAEQLLGHRVIGPQGAAVRQGAGQADEALLSVRVHGGEQERHGDGLDQHQPVRGRRDGVAVLRENTVLRLEAAVRQEPDRGDPPVVPLGERAAVAEEVTALRVADRPAAAVRLHLARDRSADVVHGVALAVAVAQLACGRWIEDGMDEGVLGHVHVARLAGRPGHAALGDIGGVDPDHLPIE
ncbi:hypothetical protein [Staphylococcus capitis]|uniref:hypothetical protein n=1 Tax=Staphylococcus capitis TaxID=29388 RepID=UPI003D043FAF